MAAVLDNGLSQETQTTNATPAIAYPVSIPANSMYQIDAKVFARNAAGTVQGFWRLAGIGQRGAGSASIVGSVINIIAAQKDALALAWDATLSASGNNINVNITGAAATTINWLVVIDGIRYTP